MYNLFVSADPNSWNGDPWVIEVGRCIREYTDTHLTARFGDFTPSQVDELRRLRSVFSYESQCNKAPHFGVIRAAFRRRQKVRIEYDLIPLDRFLTAAELVDLEFELDISRWEMNRTHWAVKDVNLGKELHAKGISLPHWARSATKAVDITTCQFDVALSFPGEIREYVEAVAAELERILGPNSYFYDHNYVSQLARPNLDVLLQEIYRDRSALVVAFLGVEYQRKQWCGLELRAIRELIMERDEQKVMFVRMDDAVIDGVSKADGYVDGRQHEPRDIARFIQERVVLIGRPTPG